MKYVLFASLTEEEKKAAIDKVIEHSSPRQDFFLMVVLSVMMATFGLLLNSVAVIIGSMLIAPLLYPILSLSLGVVIADPKVISRSFLTLIKAVLISVVFAAFIAFFFSPSVFSMNAEILSRTEPSLSYAVIAVIAGMAASFATVKEHLNEAFPGIAISVALIPPISVIGIGLAKLDLLIIKNALILLSLNVVGIVFASIVVYSMMSLYLRKTDVQKAVERDEKEVLEEKQAAVEEKPVIDSDNFLDNEKNKVVG